MKCEDLDRLAESCHDGQLDERVRRECDEHMQSCPRCARTRDELRRLDRALRSWREPARSGDSAFEERVMRAVAARPSRSFELSGWRWALVAGCAAALALVSVSVVWLRQARTTPDAVVEQRPGVTQAGPARVSPPELSSSPGEDARTLYYRGLELMQNGEEERARDLFGQVSSRYPESGLAPGAAYYQAYLLDGSSEFASSDETALRARLAAWEGIRADSLGDPEAERTSYFRALIAFRLWGRSRVEADRQRAFSHAQAYLSRFTRESRAVEFWLAQLR